MVMVRKIVSESSHKLLLQTAFAFALRESGRG
jgi:hypothetical protein